MSALSPKADIRHRAWRVRFVPKAEVMQCNKKSSYSITSSASNLHRWWHRQTVPEVDIPGEHFPNSYADRTY
jgi:hypothetical protein